MTNADKFKEIFGIYATELWAKPEKEFLEWLNEDVPDTNVGGTISRQAVAYLDLFTKTYCRDYSVTDDLVFRCKECEFEASGGKCLVKCMARMLCPDYKEFGCMGDL